MGASVATLEVSVYSAVCALCCTSFKSLDEKWEVVRGHSSCMSLSVSGFFFPLLFMLMSWVGAGGGADKGWCVPTSYVLV